MALFSFAKGKIAERQNAEFILPIIKGSLIATSAVSFFVLVSQ